jgi:polyadenylate-binding protein
LNFTDISGKQCRIMWSQRDPALRKSGLGNTFIKNLDPNLDNKSMMDIFSVFGNILSCKVTTDSEGRSKGYGYVHFDTTEAAKKAIERYDEQLLGSQVVRVQFFQRKEDRVKNVEWTNVYIKNIPQEWNEEILATMFDRFGKCTSIKIAHDPEVNPNSDNVHRGFGFVNFSTHESAKEAVESYNNKPVEVSPGIALYVARFQTKYERIREKEKNYAARKFEKMQRYNGVNLYLKNFDDFVNENHLREVFSKFGNVISTRVMRDLNGYSRGFGFVSFSNVEEARRAITEMNNFNVWGKPLKVCLALSREQRQAQTQVSQQMFSRVYPPVYNIPAVYMPNQPVANSARPYTMMPLMQRPSPQRPSIPYRTYAMPPYQMNQFPQVNQVYPNQQQQQIPLQQVPQQQQQQGMQRKPRPTKPITNRNQKPTQISSNRGNITEQGHFQPQIHQELHQPSAASLTSQMLAALDEKSRKQIIGERLFPKIYEKCPEFAPKITGMLLEMENTELLHFSETESALDAKIEEAIAVLQKFSQHQA